MMNKLIMAVVVKHKIIWLIYWLLTIAFRVIGNVNLYFCHLDALSLRGQDKDKMAIAGVEIIQKIFRIVSLPEINKVMPRINTNTMAIFTFSIIP